MLEVNGTRIDATFLRKTAISRTRLRSLSRDLPTVTATASRMNTRSPMDSTASTRRTPCSTAIPIASRISKNGIRSGDNPASGCHDGVAAMAASRLLPGPSPTAVIRATWAALSCLRVIFSFLSRSREQDVIYYLSLFLSERIYVSKSLSLLPHCLLDCFVRGRRARVG